MRLLELRKALEMHCLKGCVVADAKLTQWGCGVNLGLVYAVSPRLYTDCDIVRVGPT